MAITQRSNPDDFRPAFNAIEYSFSSDNVGECDFQFIADLYVNGDFAIRLNAFPEGDNDYGFFRVEKVLQAYLSFDFHEDLVGFAQNKQSICSYYLEVRERYNSNATCTGSSTLSAVLLTTATRYAWNGAVQYEDMPVYDQSRYVTENSLSKFLTKSPTRIKIPSDADFNISFLQSGAVSNITILTYDRYDTLIGTYSIANTFNLSSPNVPEDYHLSVGVGPEQLNAATLSSGIQPVYHENVHYYQVYLKDSGFNTLTETKEFEIDSRCSRYDPYRIWWLNTMGGFDSYTFPLKYSRTTSVSKNSFEKLLESNYALGDRGDTIINVDAKDAYTFNSNFLSYEEGLWLEELFTSPEVKLLRPGVSSGTEYEVTGVVHRASNSTADFVLASSAELEAGTVFYYQVDNGASIGMSNSGTGEITGFTAGNNRTTVPSTINAGAVITGTLIANYTGLTGRDKYFIPINVTTPSFDEKDKSVRYQVEARPAFKKNIQRQ
jgi:hypothetical protein